MTIREFQIKLDKQVKNMRTFTEPLRIAAFSVTAQMGERIFDDGKREDGGDIGKYSEKPTYVSLAVAPKPKGAPTGKTGKSKFKDGKPHKSKYFATGYKGYRDNVGRQTGYVDLSLTGELRMDFGNRKVNDFEYQIRLDKEIDRKKREGAEEKYGSVFTPSDIETNLFFDVIQFEFNKRLANQK